MGLSNRAEKYVKGLRREVAYVISEEELTGYLNRHSIPAFPAVTETVLKYAGLVLVNLHSCAVFSSEFITREDLTSIYFCRPEVYNLGNEVWFGFGVHSIAQFQFLIKDDGAIGVYDNSGEENIANPIYTSFEKMIEEYAILNAMNFDVYNSNPDYYELPDPVAFDHKWRHARVYPEASDEYNAWYQVGNILVQKGIWLDSHRSYVHFYSRDQLACEAFMKDLKNNAH